MRFAAAAFACCVWLVTLAASPPSFAYDAFAPLEYEVDATATEGGLQESHVSFRSGTALIHAVLVSPAKPEGSLPGVLFVHGSGAGASDERGFLADAEWLARRGAVSLLPSEPWSRRDWLATPAGNRAADSVPIVIALRRCLDVLEKAPGVDAKRLAYVGQDLGAGYGALLAAADVRPTWFVFMSPAARLSSGLADASADSASALARATFSGSLTQLAKGEGTSPEGRTFVAALPAGDRTIDAYDATGAALPDVATDDRRLWLGRRLGLAAL